MTNARVKVLVSGVRCPTMGVAGIQIRKLRAGVQVHATATVANVHGYDRNTHDQIGLKGHFP